MSDLDCHGRSAGSGHREDLRDVDLYPVGRSFRRPPRRVRHSTVVRDAAIRVWAALDDVLDEVETISNRGWPDRHAGADARYASKAAVDAASYLLEHLEPDLDDLLAAAQPIIDAHWLGRNEPFPVTARVHEAAERLRRTVAEARYGIGDEGSVAFRVTKRRSFAAAA